MEKMISKIKALLAKAQGTDNEAEAAAFFAKAYELMETHQLDASDLDRDDPLGHERLFESKTGSAGDWDFRLMFAVARYYGCKANRTYYGYHRGYHMTLVGRVSARVTAVEMHKYLVTVVRRLGRERAAEMGLKPDAAARRIGVALHERLSILWSRNQKAPKTEAAAKNALVTLDAVDALYKELFPNVRNVKGAKLTNELAREAAGGISLNLQTGKSDTLRIGGR